jgi:trimethylamine-N-oxide reductase (cytochrome c)
LFNKKEKQTDKEKKQAGEVSRRDFLVGAGTVVVGGAIGAGVLSGCGEKTVTETVKVTETKTVPTTITTTSMVGEGEVVTVTALGEGTVSKSSTTTVGGVEPAFEEEETVISDVGVNVKGEPVAFDLKNGKIVRIRPIHWDEQYTSNELAPAIWEVEAKGLKFASHEKSEPGYLSWGYKRRIYSPNRVRYPLQRVDWDPNGERNPQNRGISKYKRISWDTAVEIMANEIQRIHNTYGPLGILCVGDNGHHEPKTVHACGGVHMRLCKVLGGYTREVRNPDSWEGWYWGARHVWGDMSLGIPVPGVSIEELGQDTEMIVWQCGDWETTSGGAHPRWKSRALYWFTELGIKQIWICPELNYAAAVHADKWIPILPATDAAMQLAVI